MLEHQKWLHSQAVCWGRSRRLGEGEGMGSCSSLM
jgi:hypothetical protein